MANLYPILNFDKDKTAMCMLEKVERKKKGLGNADTSPSLTRPYTVHTPHSRFLMSVNLRHMSSFCCQGQGEGKVKREGKGHSNNG